jgi:hypothetical protein
MSPRIQAPDAEAELVFGVTVSTSSRSIVDGEELCTGDGRQWKRKFLKGMS